MIKDIFNNRFFIIILYLIGVLFFVKISPYQFPNLEIKYFNNQIFIFLTLIIIMFFSHYNFSLGLLGTLLFLYFLVVKNFNYPAVISENFENNIDDENEDDNEDDNEEQEDDDDDDNDDNDDEDDDDTVKDEDDNDDDDQVNT